MNAQKVWKHFYRQIIDGMIVPVYIPDQRNDMLRYRREAALERKLEAANRRIAELEARVEALEAEIMQQHHIASACAADSDNLQEKLDWLILTDPEVTL